MPAVKSLFDRTNEFLHNLSKKKYDTSTKNVYNDFPVFMQSVRKTRHPEALTWYSDADYTNKNARLYKLKDFDAGYAIADNGDIITVHNNSGVPLMGESLTRDAIENGGNHLDNFDIPRLNESYESAGLQEYGRMKWDDQYAPKGWDYERNGRPDVILRGLPNYVEKFCADPKNAETCNRLTPEMRDRINRIRFGR